MALEVRGEVDVLRDGSGPKNGGETAGAMSGGSAPPACSARPREGRRRGETGFGW